MGQYKLWIKYYRRLTKHMRPTTITQTMDQQLLWDDLQSICVQQQYTNMVKRRIDMGSYHPLPLRKIFVLKALDVEIVTESKGVVPT